MKYLMYQLSIEFVAPGVLLLLCNGNFMGNIVVKHNFEDLESLLKLVRSLPTATTGYGNINIESDSTLIFDQSNEVHDIAIPMNTPGLKEALYKMYNSLNSRE